MAGTARTRGDVSWLVALTAGVVVTGMAYSLWWPAVVRHHPWYWVVPGDVWYTVRTAHWVGWGSLSFVYSNYRSALVTLPGFDILFAPVVMIASALHLSEVAPGLLGPAKPTEWLVVGPLFMACAAPALFALDALGRRLGITTTSRRVVSLAQAAAMWPLVVMWGHPEDALALCLALYALMKALDERVTAAGWLLGAALTMQLFVVMLVPLFIGVLGWRRATGLLARAAILPACLLVAVLVPDFHAAYWVLVNQPSDPTPNHVTPWFALAPHLGRGPLVSGGPGRLLNGLVAIGTGVMARRWRGDPWRLVWLAAMVLAARPLLEAVMVPYYVAPGLVLLLIVAARQRSRRWSAACVAGAGLTVMPFSHHGRWEYWLALAALTALTLVLAWPGHRRERSSVPRAPLAPDPRDASIAGPGGANSDMATAKSIPKGAEPARL